MPGDDVPWPLDGHVQPSVHLVRHAEQVADLALTRYKTRFSRYLTSQRGHGFGRDDLEQHWREYWEVQKNRVLLSASADTVRCPDQHSGAHRATRHRQLPGSATFEERRSARALPDLVADVTPAEWRQSA